MLLLVVLLLLLLLLLVPGFWLRQEQVESTTPGRLSQRIHDRGCRPGCRWEPRCGSRSAVVQPSLPGTGLRTDLGPAQVSRAPDLAWSISADTRMCCRGSGIVISSPKEQVSGKICHQAPQHTPEKCPAPLQGFGAYVSVFSTYPDLTNSSIRQPRTVL